MAKEIKVAVSPFYGGEDWTCDRTGITFKRDDRGLNSYTVPATADLTNIRRAIRLNALLLMSGELPEEVSQEPTKEEPLFESKEEAKAEVVEEVVEEKPKAKSTRKKSTNKK